MYQQTAVLVDHLGSDTHTHTHTQRSTAASCAVGKRSTEQDNVTPIPTSAPSTT